LFSAAKRFVNAQDTLPRHRFEPLLLYLFHACLERRFRVFCTETLIRCRSATVPAPFPSSRD
jgi:hypothetical protein